jgi:hypothetical protein
MRTVFRSNVTCLDVKTGIDAHLSRIVCSTKNSDKPRGTLIVATRASTPPKRGMNACFMGDS